MHSSADNISVHDAFFGAVSALAKDSKQARPCRALSDHDWLLLNLTRVFESSQSGRGFLQEHAPRFPNSPGHSTYFQTLHSLRRLKFLQDVHRQFLAKTACPSLLREFPDLDPYECFAIDGHWHKLSHTRSPRGRQARHRGPSL
jgi:hypothetical protein